MDRIDIHIETPAVKIDELQSEKPGESSEQMRTRILACREIQKNRYEKFVRNNPTNATIPQKHMDNICEIGDNEKALLKKAMKQLSLSARAYNKILKVSRTIADLEHSINIQSQHLLEAIQYRSLDRNL